MLSAWLVAAQQRLSTVENTSNLIKHLSSCHNEEHQKCVEEQDKRKNVSPSTSTQITLTERLSSTKKYPKDSAKCKKLDDTLVEMITTDMQQYRTLVLRNTHHFLIPVLKFRVEEL
uniref:Uncharacterized protein n=1 Tax=Amphimedon queenslandica TaxID=400682 RepID=A0A1X7VTG0_AMPQE